jgi:hypothetical protein
LISPRGDCAHIPDHWTLCVEMRCADQQSAAVSVLVCNGCQEFERHVVLDQSDHRRSQSNASVPANSNGLRCTFSP